MSDHTPERFATITYRKDGKTYLLSMPSEHAEWAKEILNTDIAEVERSAAEKAWDEGYQEANSDLWREGGREGNPYRAEAYRREGKE